MASSIFSQAVIKSPTSNQFPAKATTSLGGTGGTQLRPPSSRVRTPLSVSVRASLTFTTQPVITKSWPVSNQFPAKAANTSFGWAGGSYYFRHVSPSHSTAASPRRVRRIPFPDYIIIEEYFKKEEEEEERSGKRSPGAALTATCTNNEKLDIARQIRRVKVVDIIESAVSNPDFEAMKWIASEVGNVVEDSDHVPIICALANCNDSEIDRAWDAVKYAAKPRIRISISICKKDIIHKMKLTPERVILKATSMVAYARSLGCHDVHFTPQNACSNGDLLNQIMEHVTEAGATAISIHERAGNTSDPGTFADFIDLIEVGASGVKT